MDLGIVMRIRCAISAGASLEDIHDVIMSGYNAPTEDEFFLYYKAAEILNSHGDNYQ